MSQLIIFFLIKTPEITGLKASSGEVLLEESLYIEYEGTRRAADDQGIPNLTIILEKMTPETAGSLMGFIQYAFGIYPSLLRDINPVDQNQVEISKNISRDLRKKRLTEK